MHFGDTLGERKSGVARKRVHAAQKTSCSSQNAAVLLYAGRKAFSPSVSLLFSRGSLVSGFKVWERGQNRTPVEPGASLYFKLWLNALVKKKYAIFTQTKYDRMEACVFSSHFDLFRGRFLQVSSVSVLPTSSSYFCYFLCFSCSPSLKSDISHDISPT